jgi:mannose-1-phosphate guanylyltransferase
VGDYNTLGQVLKANDKVGNVVVEPRGSAQTFLTESKRNVVVPAAGRLIATVGVDDLIIVDTPDALLVCPRDRAQEVKGLVEELKQANRTDLV